VNLGIGVLWICIGAAAGWFGSKVMGRYARASALANISIGMLGAVLGGFVTQRWLGADLGYAGVIVGLGGALFVGCLGIFCWQALSRRKA
jgi:uncharacterized membrane protein YeaQ/YmgE (transglycosylase-associated protein family)